MYIDSNNWCSEKQAEINRAEDIARRAKAEILKSNPLAYHEYNDVLYMARCGNNDAVAELRRRDAE